MSVEYLIIGRSGAGVEIRLRLPVNPESNAYSSPFTYEDYEVEARGEVTAIGRRGLREFSLTSFFPRDYNETYCEYVAIPTPQQCVNWLEDLRNTRKPVQLVVSGAGKVNLPVTIRDLQFEPERAGNPGDVYYTITLKEYRDVVVTVVDTSKKKATTATPNTAKRPASSTAPAQVKSYTVVSGDSLWKIAARKSVYGDGSKWRKIYDANKKTIGGNPDKLVVGQKLVIPR